MPKVFFQGEEIECEPGERLRDVLLRASLSPHNGNAQWFNCKGFGTCGTCAVEIRSGQVGEKNKREQWRLDFPPHHKDSPLRLACQIKVTDDLEVIKHPGFWGEKVPTY